MSVLSGARDEAAEAPNAVVDTLKPDTCALSSTLLKHLSTHPDYAALCDAETARGTKR